MSFDAVVVGAGPAGSAAAYHLARRGRSVLLVERRAFPRDKCCGDGLTRGAVRQLAEMGVLPDLADAQRVGGVRVHMRGKGARDFPYSGFGLVLPRFDLDARLCARAVEAGATLWTAQVSGPIGGPSGVRGIEMIRDGRRTRVEAPVVVAADGAASRLARQTGLRPPGREWTGFAARAYYAGIKGTDDLLQIVLPLTDVTDKHLLPSYGWIFPLGQGRANVGVGLFGPMNPEGLRGMFDRFVADLAELDPGFATATREGPMSGAPSASTSSRSAAAFPDCCWPATPPGSSARSPEKASATPSNPARWRPPTSTPPCPARSSPAPTPGGWPPATAATSRPDATRYAATSSPGGSWTPPSTTIARCSRSAAVWRSFPTAPGPSSSFPRSHPRTPS
ncbi:FAD-dependent oxidoreductase [Actinomadura sp. ATCC 39365]